MVIAEDEALIRLDLKEMLEEEGYEVVGETGRGDEAIELVKSTGAELAILDIRMPGMDGLTAARHITGERQAAVVILTAFSQRNLIEQARDSGVLAYVPKPFEKSELVAAIEVAMGRFREMRALESENQALEERLETRKVLDRAKGLLMARYRLTEEEAYGRLRSMAMNKNLRLAEIAQRILDVEDLLG